MSSPTASIRLPTPPKDYNQGYMARLNNTLELEKQAAFFASSSSTKTTEDNSQAVSWFIG